MQKDYLHFGVTVKRSFVYFIFMFSVAILLIAQPLSSNLQVIKKPLIPDDFRAFSKAGNTIFAVSYSLSVASNFSKSTDGGNSWQTLPSSFAAGDNLNAISFVDEQTGYIGGNGGVIYKTTNGGVSWTNISAPAVYTGSINFIHFFNATTGYIAGGSVGSVNMIKTTDGGSTWSSVTNAIPTRTLYDIQWTGQTEAIAVGSGSQYMYTTDGGTNWTAGTMPGLSTTLYRIRKADATTYFVVGTAGRAFKSTDNGVTFAAVTTPTTVALYTLEFNDASNGVFLGSNGVVIRTTDGGATWTNIPLFSTEVIRTSLKDGNKILAGGYLANLGISTDAGATWKTTGSTSRDMYGVYAESNQKYTVVGDRGELHQTTDGGLTWKKSSFMVGDMLYDAYTSGSNVYTCGRLGAFFASTDNGVNWSNRSIGTTTTRNYKLAFSDLNTGYMVNNEGGVLFTTNQGVTWSAQTTIPLTTLYDIKMVNGTTGYAVGSGERLFKTTDGVNFAHGTMAVPAGQVTGVAMVDANTGYICGENGAFYKTTDGFQTVTLLSDTVALQGKVMHDIVIMGPDDVWAVGRSGVLMRRVGNVTLIDTSMKNVDFLAAHKINSSQFVLVGTGGMVYKVSSEIVPVELVSFKGIVEANSVSLNWQTATETNNKGFNIERKIGKNWETVAFVKGNGTTTSPVFYSYTDKNVTGQKVYYRLKQMDNDGSFAYSNEIEVEIGAPSQYSLEQNYPNPFNPSTVISFTTPKAGNVRLTVYNALGEAVALLADGFLEAGYHKVSFDGTGLVSGVYFYRLESGDFSAVRKLNILK